MGAVSPSERFDAYPRLTVNPIAVVLASVWRPAVAAQDPYGKGFVWAHDPS